MKSFVFAHRINFRIAFSIFLVMTFSVNSWAVDTQAEADDAVYNEVKRLAGFKEHKQDEKTFDHERERGRVAYDELLEQQSIQYKQDLEEYRKSKKKESVPEETEEYEEYVARKKKIFLEKEELEKSYAQKTDKIRKQLVKRSVSEEEELGLNVETERVDYKKRVLYGAKPQFKIGGSSSGSSGSSGFGTPARNNPSFPSQPDFSDTGFIPPPPMPEPFEPNNDFPIPPPPPDFMNDADFPPPPPPPPDFGDF